MLVWNAMHLPQYTGTFVHKPDHKGSGCGDKRSQEEEGQVFSSQPPFSPHYCWIVWGLYNCSPNLPAGPQSSLCGLNHWIITPIIATQHYSLTLGFSVIIPILPQSSPEGLYFKARISPPSDPEDLNDITKGWHGCHPDPWDVMLLSRDIYPRDIWPLPSLDAFLSYLIVACYVSFCLGRLNYV